LIRMILGRFASALVVVFFVATFGFLALKAAPGGPFDGERRVPAEVQRNIDRAYHLDWPLWKQYAHYMAGLARGDLGHSMKRTSSVNEIIAENFPRSLQLGLLALLFAVVAGVGLGVLAAARQNRAADHAAMSLALVGISMPSFVLGPLLIYWFALRLGWLPAARWEGLASMIMPAATLGLIYMGTIARLTRSGMLETIGQDYIRTARAKGLSERQVVWKHALRLGILPVVTFLGPATAYLITGSIVIETIFQVPGLGFYFISSVADRDYPVLAGVMVFYCLFLVLLNLLVDLSYGLLDPRIREARAR
jgi:ABC-type dipeptide/oligopeptide/nickel transport system permease component